MPICAGLPMPSMSPGTPLILCNSHLLLFSLPYPALPQFSGMSVTLQVTTYSTECPSPVSVSAAQCFLAWESSSWASPNNERRPTRLAFSEPQFAHPSSTLHVTPGCSEGLQQQPSGASIEDLWENKVFLKSLAVPRDTLSPTTL